MNSKLHNSLTALALSGGAVVLALGFASFPAQQARLALTEQSNVNSSLDMVVTGVEIAEEVAASANPLHSPSPIATDPAPRRTIQNRRSNRQALVMPYFSFAPRG